MGQIGNDLNRNGSMGSLPEASQGPAVLLREKFHEALNAKSEGIIRGQEVATSRINRA
jgi:hypothetical protein